MLNSTLNVDLALSPMARYQQDLQREGFRHDPAQQAAVEHLERLYQALVTADVPKPNLLSKLFGGKKLNPIKGLYFWGGVGRGKTYLMDNFFESLPFDNKIRVHFHRFMRRIHADLKLLQGAKNPLLEIAERIAREARVICFDEFFVSDITDAMILGTLFEALFERGTVLVATSNIEPDGLYKDGLQRARFLPAIAALKANTVVVNVDGGVDYRLRALTQAKTYFSPLGHDAEMHLEAVFKRLVGISADIGRSVDLDIEGRKILARQVADGVVWFDFNAICDGPRSQNDYIVLALEYHSVIISNVPVMSGTANGDSLVRRFINLVDEFYDRQVKLILSAEAPLEALYIEGRLTFEFERTKSRLLEMQSVEFLARPHRP